LKERGGGKKRRDNPLAALSLSFPAKARKKGLQRKRGGESGPRYILSSNLHASHLRKKKRKRETSKKGRRKKRAWEASSSDLQFFWGGGGQRHWEGN